MITLITVEAAYNSKLFSSDNERNTHGYANECTCFMPHFLSIPFQDYPQKEPHSLSQSESQVTAFDVMVALHNIQD